MSHTFNRDDPRRGRDKGRRFIRRASPRVRFGLGLHPLAEPADGFPLSPPPAPVTPAHEASQ